MKCIFPKTFNIDVVKREDDIQFEVKMNPQEMRELANDILRNASIQEVVVAIREINSELPKAYRQTGEYGLAKIYLGEVSTDGLDKPTWENIRMQIEKQINGGVTNGTQR